MTNFHAFAIGLNADTLGPMLLFVGLIFFRHYDFRVGTTTASAVLLSLLGTSSPTLQDYLHCVGGFWHS
ncbi:hypothetical protein OK016_00635 [Vibrio chagasii]|nr:hypothetical protein [Vibrio chagasii]